jgi:hypothetical protein
MSARLAAVTLIYLWLPMQSWAQDEALRLPSFEHLRDKAIESVDIQIGTWPLRIAAALMDEDDPEDAEVKEVLKGLKGIYVRSYEFEHDFAYSSADIEAVRKQLGAPPWHRIVHARERDEQSETDIYVATEGERDRGATQLHDRAHPGHDRPGKAGPGPGSPQDPAGRHRPRESPPLFLPRDFIDTIATEFRPTSAR